MSDSKSSVGHSQLQLKRGRVSSRGQNKRKLFKGRIIQKLTQRSVNKLIQEAHNDENTTNSENSEGSPLYSEINWEENLECDSTLVDEFAPRVQSKPDTILSNASVDQIVNQPPSPEMEEDNFDCLELQEGTEIYVRVNVLNDNPEWLAAKVMEVDYVEEELLIKYTEGNPPPPMEWMKPSSTRVRRRKPKQANAIPLLDLPTSVPVTEDHLKSEDEREEELVTAETTVQLPTRPATPTPVVLEDAKTPPSTTPLTSEKAKEHSSSETKYHRSSTTKTRGSWKRNKAAIQQRVPFTGTAKFAEGEKVLAKWSDHRMQKFPAVIKTVLSGGMYDVLFYDGFEKTISEEHLFKTTEEEIEKYQNMNPSEADSFDHLDLGSKEARRQRKKKTFDDYVFARDFKTKKRVIKMDERHSVPRKMFYMKSPSLSGDGMEEGDDKPLRHKKIRKRRRALFNPKRESSRQRILHMLAREDRAPRTPLPPSSLSPPEPSAVSATSPGTPPATAASPVIPPPTGPSPVPPPTTPTTSTTNSEAELFLGFENEEPYIRPPRAPTPPPVIETDPPPVISPEPPAVISPEPPVVIKTEPPLFIKTEPHVDPPVEIKHEITVDDRWNPNENQDYKPIDITRDGVKRKSLVVPDNYLPPGWSKHAVVSTTNNLWDVILLSPDGYQLTNAEELKEYFELSPSGGPPPSTLDFLADFNVLAKLASKQKQKEPPPTMPKIWYRRRGGRGGGYTRRGGRGHPGRMSSRGGRSGVRTLLPKYRFDHSSPASPSVTENEYRCPKETCDKRFRKESLLQMHIKHYHSELQSLGRHAPNMVDLACARSESVNSDWKSSPDGLKPAATPTIKKLLPRPLSSSSKVADELSLRDPLGDSLSTNRNTPRLPERTPTSDVPPMKRHIGEERRSTIKTMLPIRSSNHVKNTVDSDGGESEDDYIEQKKNGSRIFKPGKFRRGSRFLSAAFPDDKSEMNNSGVVIERLKSEEFINCVCGFREEDGLMIQCDICMCWQHGLCSGIENEADVPDRYVCNTCKHPFRVRSSKKYIYSQHYLTQGKLPKFNFRARNDDEITHKEMVLKRCYDLTSQLLEIKSVDRSLAAKINIAEKADHPKLYMWAKNWEDSESKLHIKQEKDVANADNQQGIKLIGPQPEAPIDLEECRIRLLDHVEQYYSQIEDRLTSLQTQIAALESIDPDLSSSSASDKVTKQTIQMLIRDLESLNKLAAIS